VLSHLPKFREDLEVIPRVADGGAIRYYIKDPDSKQIFEFGEEEYLLCQQIDGQTPFRYVLSAFQAKTGISLEINQIEAFTRKLKSLGLLDSKEKALYRTGVAEKRIGLYNPDSLLGLLAKGLGGCFSLPFLVTASLFAILSLGVALKFGREFLFEFNALKELFGPVIVLPIVFLGVFMVSPLGEVAKGIACKHYGGQVPEFGVLLAFRVYPRFYADVSDIFWFMMKPVRLRVLGAGLLSQFLLWGVCILGWQGTEAGTGLHSFFLIFVAASSIFFLLNLFPLIERDGYYLLSTWLEIPDLSNRAKAWTKSWVLRRPLPEPISAREILIFKRYGLLVGPFEVLLWCLVLGLVGSHLIRSLDGVGACLFVILLLLRFEDTLRRFFMKIPLLHWTLGSEGGGVKLRFVSRFGLWIAFVILMFVPYPFEAGGDFRLLPLHEQGIRVQVSGELAAVFVEEGQWVDKGQPVARLLGREQRKRVEQVKASIDEASARREMLVEGAKPEEIAKAAQEVNTVAKSLEYSQSQAERAVKMFNNKAISEKDYEIALRFRDLDRERLELAKKNLELVKSGFREEQVEAVEAEIRRLEVELAHVEEDLELVTIVSPIEGRIITPRLSEKVGQYLIIGDLFAVVEDSRTLLADIEVPQDDIGEVEIDAQVKLRTWAYPNTVFKGKVITIAPVAFEKSRRKIQRAFSEREWLIEQNETIRKEGKVVRVISELDNADGLLRTDMTGYAKIESQWRPVGVAFTRWLIRFLFVEVWSWIP
jgi:multidrug resistance efflux pump